MARILGRIWNIGGSTRPSRRQHPGGRGGRSSDNAGQSGSRATGSNPGQLSFPTIAGQLPSLTTAAAPPPHLRLSTIARRSSPARQLVVAVASPSTELSRSSTVARRQLDSAAVAGRRLW
ncbi:Os01g0518601 [Oryza sativa Japonica Group]|uniref:Os01g0518601 protein n=1 Tax=Oryza sativa subsp. japonica TaxID=39947 RepID=A0A0P0V3B6_ORYSJ|nr:Os01g0518601 [Oryza sativa Japonica Group]